MKMKRVLALMLALAILCALPVGCTKTAGSAAVTSGWTMTARTVDLMAGYSAQEATYRRLSDESVVGVSDFAMRLFRACNRPGENALVSPLSALAALAMTANGAAGNTRAQMEATFGAPLSELNDYFLAYRQLADDSPLKMANAIWINSAWDFKPKPAFLQTNADRYGAGAYTAPFDEETRQNLNAWVSEHTDGQIPAFLDEISDEAVMYLVNALAFSARWREPYEDTQIQEGTFTREDGVTQTATFLRAWEGYIHENDKATGFLRYYDDTEYRFLALLPREGVTVAELLASLDGQALQSFLSSGVEADVSTLLPRFKVDYDTGMADALQSMGMTDAFLGETADFSGMGSPPLKISKVLQKAHIEVDENGTKAAAATEVEDIFGTGLPEIRRQETVFLDRPFVYVILRRDIPLFVGTLMDVG